MVLTEFPQGKLFADVPNVILAEIISETLELVCRHPEILAWIDADRDQLALLKKRLREEQKAWYRHQTPAFQGFEEADDAPVVVGTLGCGRDRMPAEAVLVLLMATEYAQSIYSKKAVDRLRDSLALASYLEQCGMRMPGVRTIGDNVNAVGSETRARILQCQLADIWAEGLDSFLELHGDSTHVEASSAFPTDSSLMLKLLSRVWHDSRKLPQFGLEPFRKGWTERWLDKLKSLDFSINVAKNAKKRRRLYRKYLDTAVNLLCHLAEEAKRLHAAKGGPNLPPVMRLRLDALVDGVLQDLMDCCHVYERCRKRIREGARNQGAARIQSIADTSAAWIQKGGREPVIGYKPQVARSRNGFVTSLIVPEGNAADSAMTVDLVDAATAGTGVVPMAVSFDDGYPSAGNWEALQERGIDLVSFSGAKGRKLQGEELWGEDCMRLLRNQRSCAESTMFVLKRNQGFGRVRRRGIEPVREELLAKVILHNFGRMVELRKRRRKDESPPLAA